MVWLMDDARKNYMAPADYDNATLSPDTTSIQTLGRLETILIYNPQALTNDITRRSVGGAITGAAIGGIAGATGFGGLSEAGTAVGGFGGAIAGMAIGGVAGYFGGNLLGSDNLFRFRINPQTFKQNESKIRNFEKTMRGWETSYGGENMVSLEFSGTTGYMLPPEFLRDLGVYDVRMSLAWWNFSRFNKFYQDNDKRGEQLHLVFWARLFEGHLTKMSFQLNSDDPFQSKYTFTFMAYPDKIRGLTSLLPSWMSGVLNFSENGFTLGQQLSGGLSGGRGIMGW